MSVESPTIAVAPPTGKVYVRPSRVNTSSVSSKAKAPETPSPMSIAAASESSVADERQSRADWAPGAHRAAAFPRLRPRQSVHRRPEGARARALSRGRECGGDGARRERAS